MAHEERLEGDLGLLRVWGRQATGPHGEDFAGAPYAYLVYAHKPVVAYLPQTSVLLSEYCIEFPDETRPYGSARLPASDDVLAKWMALTGDERGLLARANMHLPGRQVDPRQVRRDLWRLRQWERARIARQQNGAGSGRSRVAGGWDVGSGDLALEAQPYCQTESSSAMIDPAFALLFPAPLFPSGEFDAAPASAW